jgi:WD40 repeat protein
VSYSHDGKFFLTAGTDGTIKVWKDDKASIAPMPVCHLIDPHGPGALSIEFAAFSPTDSKNGTYQILTAGRDKDKSAKLWNWAGNDQPPAEVRKFPHDSEVRSAAFSHDAGQIACGCQDGTVWVWDAKDEKQALRKTKKQAQNDDQQGGHSRPVRHVVFANGDKNWIVSAGDDNLAYVWKNNGETLTVHAVLKGHAAAVRSVAFSPKNDRIVTGSDDTFAKVWDPRLDLKDVDPANPYAARELLTLSRHQRPVTTVAFSPGEGRIVMTASNDGDTILWLSKPTDEQKDEGKQEQIVAQSRG